MRANRHTWRAFRGRRVYQLDVSEMLVLRVAAQIRYVLALQWIIEIREAGVVELQIGATEPAERGNLIGIHRAKVAPKFLEVRVNGSIDRHAPAAIVHHARRRDAQLGRCLRDRLQELEIVGEDALL